MPVARACAMWMANGILGWSVVEREQEAFAELEAAKKLADAHQGCCLTSEERCSADIDNVQGHGRRDIEWQKSATFELTMRLYVWP